MVRILFTVCGVGLGHAPRSIEVIKGLQKNHDILIASYGDALKYLKKHFKKSEKLAWFKLVFQEGELKRTATVLSNLPLLPRVASMNFLKLVKTIRKFKPDIIISDFDVNSLYAAQLFNIPAIVISSLHLIEELNLRLSRKEKIIFYLTEKPVLNAFNGADAFIIPFFFEPEFKRKKRYFFGPIVRQELIKKIKASKKTTEENQFIVYFSTGHLKKLIPLLEKINSRFIIFGAKKRFNKSNLVFKKFSEKEFINDLVESKGVLCHGGTTTIGEALAAGKPVYVCSSRKFFERYVNGALLSHKGFGFLEERPSMNGLQEFISNNASYKQSIARAGIMPSNEKVLSRIEELIKQKTRLKKKPLFYYPQFNSIDLKQLKNYFSRIFEV